MESGMERLCWGNVFIAGLSLAAEEREAVRLITFTLTKRPSSTVSKCFFHKQARDTGPRPNRGSRNHPRQLGTIPAPPRSQQPEGPGVASRVDPRTLPTLGDTGLDLPRGASNNPALCDSLQSQGLGKAVSFHLPRP